MKTALLLILAATFSTIFVKPAYSVQKACNVRDFLDTQQDREAPTAEQIVTSLLQKKDTRSALKQAWLGSHFSKDIYREKGGYIYANPNNPLQLQVVLAPESASKSFKLHGNTNPSIDLNRAGSANAKEGWILVANFHTHPLNKNQEPSDADLRNAFRRGVPGIVIARQNIWVYGPQKREDFKPIGNPHAYPEDNDMSNFNVQARGSVKSVRNNPFPALS